MAEIKPVYKEALILLGDIMEWEVEKPYFEHNKKQVMNHLGSNLSINPDHVIEKLEEFGLIGIDSRNRIYLTQDGYNLGYEDSTTKKKKDHEEELKKQK